MGSRWNLICLLLGCAFAAQPCQVTLKATNSKATCAAPPGWASRPPRFVDVPITKIENPSGQSFSVYLYGVTGKSLPELLGNVTAYPADRTGTFTLRVPASKPPSRISVEIRRTLEAQPWKPITVTIGPLRWLYEER